MYTCRNDTVNADNSLNKLGDDCIGMERLFQDSASTSKELHFRLIGSEELYISQSSEPSGPN